MTVKDNEQKIKQVEGQVRQLVRQTEAASEAAYQSACPHQQIKVVIDHDGYVFGATCESCGKTLLRSGKWDVATRAGKKIHRLFVAK